MMERLATLIVAVVMTTLLVGLVALVSSFLFQTDPWHLPTAVTWVLLANVTYNHMRMADKMRAELKALKHEARKR